MRIGPSFLFYIIVLMISVSCSRNVPQQPILSWDRMDYYYPQLDVPPIEQELPRRAFPIAGTISHHLLTGELMDRWFQELASRREVECFYVLSPRHWDLGSGDFSLTLNSWETQSGYVHSDQSRAERLCERLEGRMERDVFVREHGVDALMPFIAKYFPDARVVAVCYPGEPPVNMPMAQRLWSAIEREFSPGKRNENFLLVSVDFSHHGNPEVTRERDATSRIFIENPGSDTWIYSACDNRPAMFAYGKLADTLDQPVNTLMYHTDSYALFGMDPHDITSYFFSFLWEGAFED